MTFDADAFVRGILSGHIRPTKVETKGGANGTWWTYYDFPDFRCQIHAHFADAAREQVLPSHIVPYSRDERGTIPIDNHILAILRHYAEEGGGHAAPGGRTRSKTRRRVALVLILAVLAIWSVPRARREYRAWDSRRIERLSTHDAGTFDVPLNGSSTASSANFSVTLRIKHEAVRSGLTNERLARANEPVGAAIRSVLPQEIGFSELFPLSIGERHYSCHGTSPARCSKRATPSFPPEFYSSIVDRTEAQIRRQVNSLFAARYGPDAIAIVEMALISPPAPEYAAESNWDGALMRRAPYSSICSQSYTSGNRLPKGETRPVVGFVSRSGCREVAVVSGGWRLWIDARYVTIVANEQ